METDIASAQGRCQNRGNSDLERKADDRRRNRQRRRQRVYTVESEKHFEEKVHWCQGCVEPERRPVFGKGGSVNNSTIRKEKSPESVSGIFVLRKSPPA